jgi:hypothetical protein
MLTPVYKRGSGIVSVECVSQPASRPFDDVVGRKQNLQSFTYSQPKQITRSTTV